MSLLFSPPRLILGLIIALAIILLIIYLGDFVRNQYLYILLSTLIFLVLHCGSPLLAANAPITIEADHMSSLEENNNVLFKGNVDAAQADVRIQSDEMTVYYTPAKDGNKQEVKRLKCIGNVEITKGEFLGTGKTMNYLAKERKIILSGDAKAWQGTNFVSGKTIIYYLDEKRSEVVGDRPGGTFNSDSGKKKKSSRVKAILTPQ